MFVALLRLSMMELQRILSHLIPRSSENMRRGSETMPAGAGFFCVNPLIPDRRF